MRTLSLFLMLALFLSACGNSTSTETATEEPETTEVEVKDKYVLSPFSESTDYPTAQLALDGYKKGKFNFTVSGDAYKLGVQTPDVDQKMCANSAKGQHIHLIIDNQPYSAQYVSAFDYDVADGEHYMLAFLSRSYHESIKHKAASVTKKINVKNKSIESSEDITGPMLFYSRPKGTYVGAKETEQVMLDFYLVNASLGDEYTLKAEINGEPHIIREWKPFYIEGLPMGDNTIKLTLLDKDGNPANIPLNPVERTFTLKEDPAEVQ